MLFALNLFDLRLGYDLFTNANRLEELDIRCTQDDIRMINSDHGGIVGQAENKATVDQPRLIVIAVDSFFRHGL